MLYEDVTHGAVVAGWKFSTDGKVTANEAETIRDALRQINESHDTQVKMFVPGDSSNSHMTKNAPLYTFSLVFGLPVVTSMTVDPMEVRVDEVQETLDEAEKVPGQLWSDLEEHSDIFSGVDIGGPQTYLLCYGPLPKATLSAGVKHPSEDRENVRYNFHSVQDYTQQWLDTGVDGEAIASCRHGDVMPVDLSEEAVTNWLEKVADFDDPKVYMTVRFD